MKNVIAPIVTNMGWDTTKIGLRVYWRLRRRFDQSEGYYFTGVASHETSECLVTSPAVVEIRGQPSVLAPPEWI